ncbi:hypothetical protein O181_039554 [Austropuccinia psidii MF-1]|uniref:Uncharacterized protein n=1 Tax=Austropuccinia psidii MF-1 TaxID=1389203 RepID=A0A9Q3HEN1_9BASI|nr:hypothetical protein [Austropuccinia psidii MF-1]
MTISPVMEAATFIRSLNNGRDLTGLIKTLYDITQFNLSTVVYQVAVEHSRQQQPTDQALFKNSKFQQKPKQEENKFKGKGQKFGKKPEKENKQSTTKTEADKCFEIVEKMIPNLQETMNQHSANLVTKQPEKMASSDSNTFMIRKEMVLCVDEGSKISLDSMTGKYVVNGLKLLKSPVNVQHKITTNDSPVLITHKGTLELKELTIYLVLFAPKFPVNSLSVSQLLDHGMKPVINNNSFFLKKGKSIIDFSKEKEICFLLNFHLKEPS